MARHGGRMMLKSGRWLGCAAVMCLTVAQLSGCSSRPLVSGFKVPGSSHAAAHPWQTRISSRPPRRTICWRRPATMRSREIFPTQLACIAST